MRQIERMTAEAWRQDGVLTILDVEWLLGVSSSLIRELLEVYQEKFGVLLPTAGTILDMGHTLTHKTIVSENTRSNRKPLSSGGRHQTGRETSTTVPPRPTRTRL